MMVSEATAKRIADSLERLERLLEKVARPPMMAPRPSWPASHCNYCGGDHGNGLPCPLLTPMARGS